MELCNYFQCNITPTKALDSAPSAIILLTYFQRSDNFLYQDSIAITHVILIALNL